MLNPARVLNTDYCTLASSLTLLGVQDSWIKVKFCKTADSECFRGSDHGENAGDNDDMNKTYVSLVAEKQPPQALPAMPFHSRSFI